ncbi:hypothetical protein B0T21DRAFT_180083 [Apiosordaria backusii]|uniref:Uncharacterized protein n=1 Tax=Apiosordaria backusii TaxID=314023 RepID=A0AA40EDZ6_9PEZI|nr:hypothetical protein B0T21DRAFT_180083 [Apiosordaria backusii]
MVKSVCRGCVGVVGASWLMMEVSMARDVFPGQFETSASKSWMASAVHSGRWSIGWKGGAEEMHTADVRSFDVEVWPVYLGSRGVVQQRVKVGQL